MPTDPESDLNKEDLSEKRETGVREAVKLRNNEASLVLLEARLRELVNVLNMEFFSAELPLNVIDPVRVLKMEFFSEIAEPIAIVPVGLTVHVVATPAWTVQETGFVVEA